MNDPEPREPLWLEEFPIETAAERYVTRRQFAKFLILGSAGMLGGNLWIVAKEINELKEVFPAVTIARSGEIALGAVKLFDYPTKNDPCLLIRLSEDEYVAYGQKCTHLSCAVYFDRKSRDICCPCHDGRFSSTDGRVLSGPPPRPLPKILLERRGDEIVAVGVDLRGGD